MVSLFKSLLVWILVLEVVAQQDYADYPEYQDYGDDYGQDGQDNLYANYAAHQQEKVAGGGGMGMGKLAVCSAVSWFLGGKLHAGRAVKKLKAKFQKDQKQLYSQYYNDVYQLSEQNQELKYLVADLKEALRQTEAKAELEALQRDYDEFKQPDIDGDDRISRAEFNMYVKNYLSHYPGLTEKDYPKFEDFDHDGDGFVSFQEYAQQMALQAQQAELEASKKDKSSAGGASSTAATNKAKGLKNLYGETKKADTFKDLYAQLGAAARR